MEPEGSISNSQELSTYSYSEPDQSSPHHPSSGDGREEILLGPNHWTQVFTFPQLKTETDPVSETLCFLATVDSRLSARGLTALRLNRGNVFLKKKFYFP
jgi:hypothetical protein